MTTKKVCVVVGPTQVLSDVAAVRDISDHSKQSLYMLLIKLAATSAVYAIYTRGFHDKSRRHRKVRIMTVSGVDIL